MEKIRANLIYLKLAFKLNTKNKAVNAFLVLTQISSIFIMLFIFSYLYNDQMLVNQKALYTVKINNEVNYKDVKNKLNLIKVKNAQIYFDDTIYTNYKKPNNYVNEGREINNDSPNLEAVTSLSNTEFLLGDTFIFNKKEFKIVGKSFLSSTEISSQSILDDTNVSHVDIYNPIFGNKNKLIFKNELNKVFNSEVIISNTSTATIYATNIFYYIMIFTTLLSTISMFFCIIYLNKKKLKSYITFYLMGASKNTIMLIKWIENMIVFIANFIITTIIFKLIEFFLVGKIFIPLYRVSFALSIHYYLFTFLYNFIIINLLTVPYLVKSKLKIARKVYVK